MRQIKIIKSYKVLTEKPDIAFDADRAVTEFRAFYPVADYHANNVSDPHALSVLEEVAQNVLNALQRRKKALNLA